MLPCSSDSSKAGRMLTIQHYEIASDDLYDSRTAVLRVEMVNFFKEALEESHAREDYQEFIKLCIIFLGGADAAQVSFQAPGVFHRAR